MESVRDGECKVCKRLRESVKCVRDRECKECKRGRECKECNRGREYKRVRESVKSVKSVREGEWVRSVV